MFLYTIRRLKGILSNEHKISPIYLIDKEEENNPKADRLLLKNYKMSEIYKLLNKGAFPEIPMQMFLGCISEVFINNNDNDDDDKIFKENIIKKIIKYIDLGGFIQVCI